MIICGDVGMVLDGGFIDKRFIKNEYGNFPTDILWVDGNHDNHDLLKQYPVTKWNDGKVHEITPRIRHLMRGEVFTLPDGRKLFAMGGARSLFTGGDYWWPEEVPNEQERKRAISNLKKHNYKIDLVITHDCPTSFLKRFRWYNEYVDVEFNDYLESLKNTIKFKHWFFGHHHKDESEGNLHCLYESIVEVTPDCLKTWVEGGISI